MLSYCCVIQVAGTTFGLVNTSSAAARMSSGAGNASTSSLAAGCCHGRIGRS
jgi:hypothetical protein